MSTTPLIATGIIFPQSIPLDPPLEPPFPPPEVSAPIPFFISEPQSTRFFLVNVRRSVFFLASFCREYGTLKTTKGNYKELTNNRDNSRNGRRKPGPTFSSAVQRHLSCFFINVFFQYKRIILTKIQHTKCSSYSLTSLYSPIISLLHCLATEIKGTHTVYFSSSFYIINQKPMIHRTDFRCINTWVACSCL